MKSNNTLIQIVLFGYVLYLLIALISKIYQLDIPTILIIIVYYSIFSALYKKYRLFLFIISTFILLSIFLLFIQTKSLNLIEIIEIYRGFKLPFILYMNVLLPMVFLSYTFDFYQFIREIATNEKLAYVQFLVPILIKRELVQRRYNILINRLQTRGINSENLLVRFFSLDLWVLPLITTGLMEGVESFEYNLMLNVDISKYKVHRQVAIKTSTLLSLFTIFLLIMLMITNIII